jgi:PEP-CTERM motif-containing protein
MNRLLLLGVAAAALFGAPQAMAAIQVNVENVGSIFNESLALPAEATPGSGIGFAQFFEFSLPVAETVTASVSDSGIGSERIVGGLLSLNDFTSTGPGPLFQPLGTLIESTSLIDTVGGQSAEVNPDFLAAGKYFVAVTGSSGASPIHLAIDGTVTATTAVPEPSTWAMLGVGFGMLAFVGFRQRKGRLDLAI